MVHSSRFTVRTTVTIDRELYDKIDHLIEEGKFASVSHAVRLSINEWIKRHMGSEFRYLSIEDYIKKQIEKEVKPL